MSVRACILALAAFGLAGCDDAANGLTGFGPRGDATSQGIRTLALLGGDVRARGPDGYCIDQSASDAGRGFAVLAGCALLSDTASVMPGLDGLVLVQFGAPQTASVTGNEKEFATFLRSDAGRGVLAGDGDFAKVDGVQTSIGESTVHVRFEDVSDPMFHGTSGPQWRGFLDILGRLVTVSVLSFDRNSLSQADGERLLLVAMAELNAVNARSATAPVNR